MAVERVARGVTERGGESVCYMGGKAGATRVDIDQRIGINSTSEMGRAVVGDAAGGERGRRVEMQRDGLYEGADDAGLDTFPVGAHGWQLAGVYDCLKARDAA